MESEQKSVTRNKWSLEERRKSKKLRSEKGEKIAERFLCGLKGLLVYSFLDVNLVVQGWPVLSEL